MRAHAGLSAGVASRGLVRTPSMKRKLLVRNGNRIHRMGAIGTSISAHGAVRHNPMSDFSNSPQCITVAVCGKARSARLSCAAP